MWSRREMDALVQATDKALRSLRSRIGNYKLEKLKVHRSELRLIVIVWNAYEKRRVVVKYDGSNVWVEAPKHIAMPLKNKIIYFLQSQR
ncbi:hypothetical protein IPA_05845 [Ignicoccus pacificus DSM 13166]|uniref:Uncharacterized protein n=1 Tax=Ignicoccus pacificus DSM 13166 TaxID=940294 RepID=A0A977KCP7_9CREN|nr:hypothetical protein IPA_05845 [Ignicoccus pacificus DSM 13166]